jgi:hypothetical protein
MQRAMLTAGLFLAVAFSANTGKAQAFYDSGEVSIAIERALGIHYVHSSWDGPGPGDYEFDGTTIGLGWYGALSPLHWSRAAVDVFVIDQLSVGGSLAFFAQSGDPDGDGFLFAPRVGYAIPLSDLFTFWPRGGITFLDVNDNSLFALSGEATFVLTPQPSWGIILAPTVDIGFIGEEGDSDYSEFSLGIPAVGILGNF